MREVAGVLVVMAALLSSLAACSSKAPERAGDAEAPRHDAGVKDATDAKADSAAQRDATVWKSDGACFGSPSCDPIPANCTRGPASCVNSGFICAPVECPDGEAPGSFCAAWSGQCVDETRCALIGGDASQDCTPATDSGQTGCCWFVGQGAVDGGTSFSCGDAGVVCDKTTQYCLLPMNGNDPQPSALMVPECDWLSSLPACNSSSVCACQKSGALGCADVGGAITLTEGLLD